VSTLDLTPRQRAHLKSLAHPLKPVIHVGKDGITDAVARSVEDSFHTRELLKIKVLESAPAGAREVGASLAAALEHVRLVQVIGRTVVLYRPHPDSPEIRLPG
jgi:RNA-binding protein